ncbi:MAG: hypothetical protein M9962_03975 [Oligoflexia bacterium]|nr:hypothetical protein [Oligoflexia bacterium]
MRVAFFCQHLLGIGHVSRSLALVNEISKIADTTYIQGGPATQKKPNQSVRTLQLPPLLMREHDSSLYDPSEKQSVEDVFLQRKQIIDQHIDLNSYDLLVIELWPFGRNKFTSEMIYLIEGLKKKNKSLKVVCSLRDILVRKKNEEIRNQKIVSLIEKYFDKIYVHSDERLILLSDSFTAYVHIAHKVCYTGFVTESSQRLINKAREKKIVISMGGGIVGEELVLAVAKIVKDFPEYRFQFILGPFSEPGLKSAIEEQVISEMDRVEICGLLDNFEDVLSSSALSISLAGYNTVMNLLNTKTFGLVFPYDANEEQRTRAEKLEAMNTLKVISRSDIASPKTLSEIVKKSLALEYPKLDLKLDGSVKTAEYILRLESV